LGLGEIPSNPAAEWTVELGDRKAYLVPLQRQLWRVAPEPARDFRPFSQRGFQKHRLIPAKIDGADVILKRLDWLGSSDAPRHFGAALFPQLTFICDEDATSFLVTRVECKALSQIIKEAICGTHQSRCIATVFPELTIDDDARKRIEMLLREKPWVDREDEQEPEALPQLPPRTPALIVAGSWHYRVEDGYANIASIYNGNGDLLLKYKKRLPFVDQHNREERIVSGDELAVIVMDNCLIAFGICFDFCNRRQNSVYDDLDVDLVLVPSCGHDTTMKGHISNAETLQIRRKSRTMVVQQAYPKRCDGIGYVPPPTERIASLPSELVEKRPWSVVSADLSCKP
jgi:predicted amidohydrolase